MRLVRFIRRLVGTIHLDRKLEEIYMSITDLTTKIDGLTSDVATLSTAVDDFIKSDETLFQALKDALAANDPATIDALIAKIDAARAALSGTKDKVVAADAADNLPTPPPVSPA